MKHDPLEGFSVVSDNVVSAHISQKHRYRPMVEAFAASGNACMVKECKSNYEAGLIVSGVNQFIQGTRRPKRLPDGSVARSENGRLIYATEFPYISAHKRGNRCYLVNREKGDVSFE